jgi:hypothetical protein
MIKSPNNPPSSQIKCSICRANIKYRHEMYQVKYNLGVICKDCQKRFPEEDIEMITNIFLIYGGYFGQLKDQAQSISDLISDFTDDLLLGKNFQELNIKLWHKVLLNGFTPKEFIDRLTEFLD